jgi:GTP pyrophosphokinase
MWSFKTELSDLAFSYLFPEEHARLNGFIQRRSHSYAAALRLAEKKVEQMIAADQWLQSRVRRTEIEGRTKSIHSTWRKMQRRDTSLEQIHDLVALRIIVFPESASAAASEEGWEGGAEENSLCYHILGKVHGCWTPMPLSLKDYISSPK